MNHDHPPRPARPPLSGGPGSRALAHAAGGLANRVVGGDAELAADWSEGVKVTLSLEMPGDAHAVLKEMAKETGRESLALLIQDGMRTYEWILSEQRSEREIVSVTSDALATLVADDPDQKIRHLVRFSRTAPQTAAADE